MKYYHDLYLICDVLLLADVYEKFRNNSLKNYGLCPSHYLVHQLYIGMPSLIWQKLSLNLFQMSTCIYYLTKGMRDGVSYISKRYSQANNKYLKSDDPKQESKHI